MVDRGWGGRLPKRKGKLERASLRPSAVGSEISCKSRLGCVCRDSAADVCIVPGAVERNWDLWKVGAILHVLD